MNSPDRKSLLLCPECGSEKIADAGPRYGKPPGQVFACPECGYEGTSVTEGDEVTAAALREVDEEVKAWSKAQLRKLCPVCGSDELKDASWRQTEWRHQCKHCDYIGAAFVEGDEEMAKALREQYETREKSNVKSGS